MRAAPCKEATLELPDNMTSNTNPTPESQAEKTPSDIFADVANIRIDPTMVGGPSVSKVLVQIPVRKPSKEWFIRTHPDIEKHTIDTLVLELKEDGEVYLVPPALRNALLGEPCVNIKRLHLSANRQGDVFIWPIRLPGADGKLDSWNESALEAANLAATKWVRLSANLRIGAYSIAVADIADAPKWPAMPFNELLRIAFKGKVIETMDHPVLRRLRGEV